MRSYVVFLWNNGFRNYKPEHVNVLAHALRHFDPEPHRFVCVTDETAGFSPAVEVLPMPAAAKALGRLKAPQGKDFPSSYRRLWCFSPEAIVLGERIMLLDIDAMIVGNMLPLWQTEGDFVGWRPKSIWGKENRIGGGTWMHAPGTLTWFWERFMADPERLIDETREIGWAGSDQALMSRFLVPKYPLWPADCGIYGSQDGVFQWDIPPPDAKVVHFNGKEKHWNGDKLWMVAYQRHFGACNLANK